MKKYLLFILLFLCCVNVVFADDINWTVKQSENYSFNNTQILTPKSSNFNKNVDCIFMPVKEKEILIDNRLEERNPGSLSGQSLDVTNRDEYWNYYTEIQYGTSENIQEFFKRIYNFLDELKIKDYESVLIVAHSGVSKAFSGYFEGIQDGKFLNRGLKNCEIKMYEL